MHEKKEKDFFTFSSGSSWRKKPFQRDRERERLSEIRKDRKGVGDRKIDWERYIKIGWERERGRERLSENEREREGREGT